MDIHRHSPVNVESVDTARALKVRANDSRNAAGYPHRRGSVTLTQYTKKSAKVSSWLCPLTYTTVPSDFGPVTYNKKGTKASSRVP